MTPQRRPVDMRVIYLCIAVVAAGCSHGWRPPLYQKPGFHTQWVDKIAILPPFDARIDKSTEVDLNEQLRTASANILTDKGYVTVLSESSNPGPAVTSDDLAEPDAAWVRELGAPGERWMMMVSLVDVTSSMVFFGSTGNAQVVAYLYDKKDGTLVWRDKGAAQVGQGGLIGMALKDSMDEAAINEALGRLFASIPDRTANNPYIPEPPDTGVSLTGPTPASSL